MRKNNENDPDCIAFIPDPDPDPGIYHSANNIPLWDVLDNAIRTIGSRAIKIEDQYDIHHNNKLYNTMIRLQSNHGNPMDRKLATKDLLDNYKIELQYLEHSPVFPRRRWSLRYKIKCIEYAMTLWSK